VISNKHDHHADDRDKHAVYIETGHSGLGEKPKQPTADHRSDHPETDVEEGTFSFLAMKPATNPRIIQPIIDMPFPPRTGIPDLPSLCSDARLLAI
jgi:hypothetical protein